MNLTSSHIPAVTPFRLAGRCFRPAILASLAALLAPGMLSVASADVVHYQGRLSVDGVPHQGEGRFKFALVSDQRATLWASKEMSLNVRDGAYAVPLGDSAHAPTISAAALAGAACFVLFHATRPPAATKP